MDIDTAIGALNRKAAEYRLNELLQVSSSRFKIQPNLDSLYEADCLEQVANYLTELKEARLKLSQIERIARESFSPDVSSMDTTRRSYHREQAIANIFAIFEYNGATIKEESTLAHAPEDKSQITIEDVLENEKDF